jgi:hypothetical protein
MEDTMPVTNIIVIAAIILAFGSFAAVLAWADMYTRAAGK